MNATRTDPRVHCFQRRAAGDYVPASGTTPNHLRAVFEAERQRLAEAAKPARRRRRADPAPAANPQQAQLQLVA
ncbi:hypothetical protein [Paracidovorax konjaci]|uniref:Uncharacterized protein n=1 Tax=Paracidovorax konjaci TaxID=32040 RepID=A0A1I1XQ76_9BURK|nr:hypothetical protein [Paracidovorax konjaci]SFE09486.1 hypothetical protein SAMN04489710_11451 [Paracidovorax konjaci]